MSITVQPEIWSRFPDMRILCVRGAGLDNLTPNPGTTALLQAAQDSISAESLTHEHLLLWRQAYEHVGISMGKYPCSIQAMVKRIAKGGRVPSINPLVDLYNAVSIANITPLGGLDLDQLEGSQQLRLTKADELFISIGDSEPDTVHAGEICYSDDHDVITRHFCWRQAQKGSIQPETRRFMLIAEILGEMPDSLLGNVQKQLVERLLQYFEVKAEVTIVAA